VTNLTPAATMPSERFARPVAASVLQAIGNTPMVELRRLNPNPNVRLIAKLEGANPSGSVKDRVARYLVEEFESRADSPDYILLEPTSGNTGIALAMISRVKGYRVVAVMPANVTSERRKLLEILGAEIIDSPAEKGTNGSIEMVRDLDRQQRFWVLNQYANQANPRAHFETLTGVGRRLKLERPGVKIIAAEPLPGDLVQGLRSLDDGFVPPILDASVLDRKYLINSRDSIDMMRRLASEEGIFAGVSSGAILVAAIRYTEHMEEGTVVVLLPDGGWKYLSGDLWTADTSSLEEGLESAFLW